MIKEREINYDILRGLITVGVVMLHVFAKIQQNGNISYIQISLINTVCSLCVPCFFMLSGAFTLSKSNFSSSIIKIAGPAVIAILVYDLFSFQYLIRHGNSITIAVFEIIKNTIYGRPYYHLWFVYVIISLYAVSLLISKLKNNISHKNYAFLTIGFLVLAVIMGSYFKSDFEYGINSLKYIGYYMLGEVLYRRIKQGHFISYNRGVVIVITAFLCIFAAALSSYECFLLGKHTVERVCSGLSPLRRDRLWC